MHRIGPPPENFQLAAGGLDMSRIACACYLATLGIFCATTALAQPQVVDLDYDTSVAPPGLHNAASGRSL